MLFSISLFKFFTIITVPILSPCAPNNHINARKWKWKWIALQVNIAENIILLRSYSNISWDFVMCGAIPTVIMPTRCNFWFTTIPCYRRIHVLLVCVIIREHCIYQTETQAITIPHREESVSLSAMLVLQAAI